jgi:uncharacterized protein YwqG
MAVDAKAGEPSDRYSELMSRHAALQREISRRLEQHRRSVSEQHPILGSGRSFGGSTDGIKLAADGELIATLRLRDPHGAETEVVLSARPGGPVEVMRPSEPEPQPALPPQSFDETDERLRTVTALAHQHLPVPAAADFLSMLRPALRLVHAGEGDPVIAQLGGLPTLPVNSWPVWEGHGPLSHVLSFDCAPVAQLLPGLGLPQDGRLAFFYFNRAYDDVGGTVSVWDPSTHSGFRVLHLHPERSVRANVTDAATPAPPGLGTFAPVALTAVRTLTWPAHETPAAEEVWRRHGLAGPRDGVAADPVRALYDALWELPGGGYDTHQIGGHPCPQQGPVEMDVEQLRRGLAGEPFEWSDPDVQAAASSWQLLLQVASDDDADMMWGDAGQLYYLVTDPEDPEEALVTLQCG